MGEKRVLPGHVQSIAAGIEDRDRTNGSNLLPNVNPTFNWVRLAQRVPVRIQFDQMPDDVRLVAGRTATVSVKADGKTADQPAAPAAAADKSASQDKVALAGKSASATGALQ
jgi:multidrug resistance efflux pump